MNEWLQKTLTKLKELWAKWSVVQKVILFGIIAAVVVAIVATYGILRSCILHQYKGCKQKAGYR